MKINKFILYSNLTLFVLISTMIAVNVYVLMDANSALDYHNALFQRASLYDTSNYIDSKVNGVYFQPNYYCVWTKGRSEREINRTDWHENCHDLVYLQHEHFCGDVEE